MLNKFPSDMNDYKTLSKDPENKTINETKHNKKPQNRKFLLKVSSFQIDTTGFVREGCFKWAKHTSATISNGTLLILAKATLHETNKFEST